MSTNDSITGCVGKCRHSPGTRDGVPWSFVSYFLCNNHCFAKFENSVCTKCGMSLLPPAQYYSPVLTISYMLFSAFTLLTSLELVQILHPSNNVCSLFSIFIALCVAFLLPVFFERCTTAIIFSVCTWNTAEMDSKGDVSHTRAINQMSIWGGRDLRRNAIFRTRLFILMMRFEPRLMPFSIIIPLFFSLWSRMKRKQIIPFFELVLELIVVFVIFLCKTPCSNVYIMLMLIILHSIAVLINENRFVN